MNAKDMFSVFIVYYMDSKQVYKKRKLWKIKNKHNSKKKRGKEAACHAERHPYHVKTVFLKQKYMYS